jgi:hypothetical protein
VLLPNDPGYVRHPDVYAQVNAPAGWGATQGKPCTAAIADLDSYASNTTDLKVRKGPNFASGSTNVAHGTEVSSVAGAAIDNGVGVPGIGNCPVISVRIFDPRGYWRESGLLSSLKWACSHPGLKVRVLNLSLGQFGYTAKMADVAVELQTCENKGILPVLAAGNGTNNDGAGVPWPGANPLASDNPETLRVAGVGPDDQIDPGSNYGPSLADIAAPMCVPTDSPSGSWGVRCGTSFSTAQVSAVAAEVFNLDPSLTAAQAKQLLMSSGRPVQDLDVTSGNILDYYNALVAAGYVPPA